MRAEAHAGGDRRAEDETLEEPDAEPLAHAGASYTEAGPRATLPAMSARTAWIGRGLASVVVLAALGCEPASVTGAWCQYPADCRRPNECSFHRCRPPCERNADCATGLCLDGHCGVEQDRGCAGPVAIPCASQLTCAEDRCALRCTSSARCAPDGVCRPAADVDTMICANPDQPVPDAGPRDAGPRDAGPRDAGGADGATPDASAIDAAARDGA